MSRSFKKHASVKWGDSDKEDKVAAHKKFRRKERQADYDDWSELEEVPEDWQDEVIVEIKKKLPPKNIREVSDTWSFNSDGGSHYLPDTEENKRLKRK